MALKLDVPRRNGVNGVPDSRVVRGRVGRVFCSVVRIPRPRISLQVPRFPVSGPGPEALFLYRGI